MKVKTQTDVPKNNSEHTSLSRNTTQKADSRQNFPGIGKRKVQSSSDGVDAAVRMHARVVKNELTLEEAKELIAGQGNISKGSCFTYFNRLYKKSEPNKRASALAKEVLRHPKEMQAEMQRTAVQKLVQETKIQADAARNNIRFFIRAESIEIYKTGTVPFMLNHKPADSDE